MIRSTYVDISSIATIDGDTVTLHLTDGGPGDQDGVANGVIVDPVIPARAAMVPSTPSITNLPASGTVGGSFIAVVSTTGDGVTSVTSSTTGVCTVSGSVVSYVGAGTCTLVAHVAAGTNYTSGTGTDQSVSVNAVPPTSLIVTTTSLPAGSLHTKATKALYSATLSAAGGNAPCKWSLVPGSTLPPGLKLKPTGLISGKATVTGTFSFTVQVVDTKTKTKPAVQHTATRALSITITN